MREKCSVRSGCYSTPVGELTIKPGREGPLLTFSGRDGITVTWVFNEDGVFRHFSTVTSAGDTEADIVSEAVVTCTHISPGYKGRAYQVTTDIQPVDSYCCRECLRVQATMDSPSLTILGREVWEDMLECDNIEVIHLSTLTKKETSHV